MKSLPIALWGMCGILSQGCGPMGPGLALEFAVLEQAGVASEPGVAPAGISAFRLCVQLPDGAVRACADFTDLRAKSFRMEELLTGPDRVVTFQGYLAPTAARERPTAVWCGRATGVDILKDETSHVRMLLSRCGDFTTTRAAPAVPRMLHAAVSLPDGRVALLGGFSSSAPDSGCTVACQALEATDAIELYDPETSLFETASAKLTHARGLCAARALPDGRILVAGGCARASLQSDFTDPDRPGSPLRCLDPGRPARTAELVDLVAGQSQVIEIPPSVFAGAVPVGVAELLLLGGEDDRGAPLRRALSLAVEAGGIEVRVLEGALAVARRAPTAVLASRPSDSPVEVVLVGGNEPDDLSTPGKFAERLAYMQGGLSSLVPPAVDAILADGMPVVLAAGARAGMGRVLVAGGLFPSRFLSHDTPFLPEPLRAAALFVLPTDEIEVLDPVSRLLKPRILHTATAVNRQGHTLVVGGFSARRGDLPLHHQAEQGLEWWDESIGFFALRWVAGQPAQMAVARAGHSATLLQDGTVLIAGGSDGIAIHASAEIFNPAPVSVEADGLPPL